jgi:hypothetical protein
MAKFTPGQPATSSSHTSQPVRDNLDALFSMDLGSLRARAESTPSMTVAVGTDASVAYVNGLTPMNYAGASSPTLTAPSGNNRLSVLTIDRSNTLAWTNGTEATSPSEPVFPYGKLPICTVFCRPGMSSIKNTDDSVNGYIYLDRRPFLNMPGSTTAINKDPTDLVSTTPAEAALHSSTIEANMLGTHNAIRCRLSGTVSITAATSGQITFRFKYGGSTLASIVMYPGTTSATGDHSWEAEVFLTAENSASVQRMSVHMFVNSNAQGANFLTFDPNLSKDSAIVVGGVGAINSATSQFLTVTCEDTSGASSARSIAISNAFTELLQ